MLTQASQTFLEEFKNHSSDEQCQDLQGMFGAAPDNVIEDAVKASPPSKQDAAAKGASAFDGLSRIQKYRLFQTLIYILAILAAAALIGGAIALINNVDSAAFFTFAGLALGGITGLYIQSPTK